MNPGLRRCQHVIGDENGSVSTCGSARARLEVLKCGLKLKEKGEAALSLNSSLQLFSHFSLILLPSTGMRFIIFTHLFGFRTGGEVVSFTSLSQQYYPPPPRTGLIMGCSFRPRRWQEVECSKQEVRVAKAKAALGHFKSHNIQKGEFDAKKGRSFLPRRVFQVSQTERGLKLGNAWACVSPPRSPLQLLRRSASFYFRLHVPLLLPRFIPTRCSDAAALLYCTVLRAGIYRSSPAPSLRFDYLPRTFVTIMPVLVFPVVL